MKDGVGSDSSELPKKQDAIRLEKPWATWQYVDE